MVCSFDLIFKIFIYVSNINQKKKGAVILRSGPIQADKKTLFCSADQDFFQKLATICPHLFILYENKYSFKIETRYSNNFSSGILDIDCIGMEQSFNRLEELCRSIYNIKVREKVQKNWLSLLEKTEWLSYISKLLDYAIRLAHLIQNGTSVLLVESDNSLFNISSLLLSLTLLMVDPHYRTIHGFETLIESHWIKFGHSFSRTVQTSKNQIIYHSSSFLFTLWMDCVLNLRNQFSHCFQFHETFLITILDHVHSGLFGQFLKKTEYERKEVNLQFLTCSLWHELNCNEMEFVNLEYSNSPYTIFPIAHIFKLSFWESYYLRWISNNVIITHSQIPNNKCIACTELESEVLSLLLQLKNQKEEYERKLALKDQEIANLKNPTSDPILENSVASSPIPFSSTLNIPRKQTSLSLDKGNTFSLSSLFFSPSKKRGQFQEEPQLSSQ